MLYRNMVFSAGVEDRGKKSEKTGNAEISKCVWNQTRNSDLPGEETEMAAGSSDTQIFIISLRSPIEVMEIAGKRTGIHSLLRTKILSFVLGVALSSCDK